MKNNKFEVGQVCDGPSLKRAELSIKLSMHGICIPITCNVGLHIAPVYTYHLVLGYIQNFKSWYDSSKLYT